MPIIPGAPVTQFEFNRASAMPAMPGGQATRTSWRYLPATLYSPVTDQGNSTLYQWGPQIQFRVLPFNVHELDHQTATDWAKKEIAGAAIYREWVGENDEVIFFRGKLFPYRIGGFGSLEFFEATRRSGQPNILQRGNGEVLGWFVCESLTRSHTFLSAEGVGQQVTFEANMVRVPIPAFDQLIPQIWGNP